MKKILWDELAAINGKTLRRKPQLLFPEHHFSHAASAFYPSPFEEAAILTVDGVGEWTTSSIGFGEGRDITFLRELTFPHSVGLLYSAFTYYLGFKVNGGEYKLMGLAPYGNKGGEPVGAFKRLIYKHLVDLRDDGSLVLNMAYFSYQTALKMCDDRKWYKLFGFSRREPESKIVQKHMDLALAIQEVTEEVILKLAKTARRLTGSRNLVMAGGVALNCVANSRLLREKIFDDIWIQPAAGDAGGALGAALAAHHVWHKKNREVDPDSSTDKMQGCYLGPEYSALDARKLCRLSGADCQEFSEFDQLTEKVATLINNGRVIGWFQGKMEWGPRALGNRSILSDPRDPDMQKRINLKIKRREGFRPFAPSVLVEECAEYFDLDHPSPYMLLTAAVTDHRCNKLPDNYEQLDMSDRLYWRRSDIPAVTHVDFSARVQTVNSDTNPRYWQLLNSFKKLTGCGLLINTSFNVRGEPIVCTPADAYECFMNTEMDYLVIGDLLFGKSSHSESSSGTE